MKITPKIIARMSAAEKRELILLLETLSLPKLARRYLDASSESHGDGDDSLLAAIRRGMDRADSGFDEEQHDKDLEELLQWYERGGVITGPPLWQAMLHGQLRVARWRREERLHPEPERVVQAAKPEPAVEPQKPEPQPVPAPPPYLAGRPAMHVAERDGEVFVAVHGVPVDHELRAPQRAESARTQRNMMDDDEINRRERAYREQHIPGGWGL